MVAQVSDLGDGVFLAPQLELYQFVDEKAIDARAYKRLTRSNLVFLAGHCESTSNFLVVDIIARIQHHEVPFGSLPAHN